MKREKCAIYYSYAEMCEKGEGRRKRTMELLMSIESLSWHNYFQIPVFVFTYGYGLKPADADKLSSLGAKICHLGSYADALDKHLSGCSRAFVHYPVLHKHMSCFSLPDDVITALYVDADTVFGRDVVHMFLEPSLRMHDVYAREDSAYCGDDGDVWCERFRYICRTKLGLTRSLPVTPFNSGVILFNRRSWTKVDIKFLLRCLIRFEMTMSLSAMRSAHVTGASKTKDIEWIQNNVQTSKKLCNCVDGLAYPCKEPWIREEVAMAVAHTHACLSFGLIGREISLQGGEESVYMANNKPFRGAPVISHYYSFNFESFTERIFPLWYHPACSMQHRERHEFQNFLQLALPTKLSSAELVLPGDLCLSGNRNVKVKTDNPSSHVSYSNGNYKNAVFTKDAILLRSRPTIDQPPIPIFVPNLIPPKKWSERHPEAAARRCSQPPPASVSSYASCVGPNVASNGGVSTQATSLSDKSVGMHVPPRGHPTLNALQYHIPPSQSCNILSSPNISPSFQHLIHSSKEGLKKCHAPTDLNFLVAQISASPTHHQRTPSLPTPRSLITPAKCSKQNNVLAQRRSAIPVIPKKNRINSKKGVKHLECVVTEPAAAVASERCSSSSSSSDGAIGASVDDIKLNTTKLSEEMTSI